MVTVSQRHPKTGTVRAVKNDESSSRVHSSDLSDRGGAASCATNVVTMADY
jgi:hypothetical protein